MKDRGQFPRENLMKNEKPLQAAIREFSEETGKDVFGRFMKLKPVTQKSGKKVFAWAIQQNIDTSHIVSNKFEMEWPPRSGKFQKLS